MTAESRDSSKDDSCMPMNLLPCPFCGEEMERAEGMILHKVFNPDCFVCEPLDCNWNRRTPAPKVSGTNIETAERLLALFWNDEVSNSEVVRQIEAALDAKDERVGKLLKAARRVVAHYAIVHAHLSAPSGGKALIDNLGEIAADFPEEQ